MSCGCEGKDAHNGMVPPVGPSSSSHEWDRRWMDLARLVATWSEDRSRKTGAVIVDGRNVPVSLGWNGFPRRVSGKVEERHARPAKYLWTEHGERNAIYNAAAVGAATAGCRIYLPWYPCSGCARAIIQAGLAEVIAVEPDWQDPAYAADFAVTREMLQEAGVHVRWAEGAPPVSATPHSPGVGNGATGSVAEAF